MLPSEGATHRVGQLVRRCAVGALCALAVAGAALVGLPAPAGATSSFTLSTLAGADRFGTAEAIAEASFPNGSPNAIIATGVNFPDALAASYLAGVVSEPILLVNPTDPVPSSTLDALSTLKVKNVTIVGGTSAVGSDVENTLASTSSTSSSGGTLNVTRIAGANRYDTMQQIDTGHTVGTASINGTSAPTGILVTGNNFPDALSAGPLAYARHLPVILTDGTQSNMSPQAKSVISSDGITNLIVIGGSAAIQPSQYSSYNHVVEAGSNRSATSQQLADFEVANLGFTDAAMDVANGYDPGFNQPGLPAGFTPDGLAGAPYGGGAASNGSSVVPLLVTNSPSDPGAASVFASSEASSLTGGTVFGGDAAVSAATRGMIESAGGSTVTPAANETYTVSPDTAQSEPVSAPGGTQGEVTYTVTGITSDNTPTGHIDIALFPADGPDAPTVSNGAWTFVAPGTPPAAGGAVGQNSTDAGTAGGYIAAVNGTATSGPSTLLVRDATPINGELTFAVNSTVPDATIPVAFSEPSAADNGVLEVTAAGQPQPGYPIGVAGEADWGAPPATSGVYNGYVVQTFNPSDHTFQACQSQGSSTCYSFSDSPPGTSSYIYPSPSGAGLVDLTQAEFEDYLSGPATPFTSAPAFPGDTLDIAYSTASGGSSSFTYVTDVPAAPSSVTATPDTTNGAMDLSWTAPANPDVAQDTSGTAEYKILRAQLFDGVPGPFNAVAGLGPAMATTVNGLPPTSYVDTTAVAGLSYEYEVEALGASDAGAATGPASAPSAAAQIGPTPAPISTSITCETCTTSNTHKSTSLGGSDEIVATFSEAVAFNSSGWYLTLTDGTDVNTLNASNTSVSLAATNGAADTEVIYTLTGGPCTGSNSTTCPAPGAAPDSGTAIPYDTNGPVEVLAQQGVTTPDASMAWNLPGSGMENPPTPFGSPISMSRVVAGIGVNDCTGKNYPCASANAGTNTGVDRTLSPPSAPSLSGTTLSVTCFAAGDKVNAYNGNGVLLGASGNCTTTAKFSLSSFPTGTPLLVTEVSTTSGNKFESLAIPVLSAITSNAAPTSVRAGTPADWILQVNGPLNANMSAAATPSVSDATTSPNGAAPALASIEFVNGYGFASETLVNATGTGNSQALAFGFLYPCSGSGCPAYSVTSPTASAVTPEAAGAAYGEVINSTSGSSFLGGPSASAGSVPCKPGTGPWSGNQTCTDSTAEKTGTAFQLQVEAVDVYGNLVSGANGTVTLQFSAGQTGASTSPAAGQNVLAVSGGYSGTLTYTSGSSSGTDQITIQGGTGSGALALPGGTFTLSIPT